MFSDFIAHTLFYEKACKSVEILKEYWDGCTDIYLENDYLVFQSGLHSNNFDSHLQILHDRHWQNGAINVLDAGCGIGSVTKHFAKLHPEAHFTCLNISSKQIELGKIGRAHV